MRAIYNTLLFPLRFLVPLAAARAGRSPERKLEWQERRARRLPEIKPGGFWIHGSSVGEARIATGLAACLNEARPDLPLALSAYTRTGRAVLEDTPFVEASFFLPLDFPGLPGKVLDAVRPSALILVETELWPNLIAAAVQRRIRILMVNGRLSPSRMKRYTRLGGLYRPVLDSFDSLGVQSESDADRFRALGVPSKRMTLTGNIKYDLPSPSVDRDKLAARFGIAPARPVLIAGSTDAGEEDKVLDAFLKTRQHHPDAWLVLAPRHPERSDAIFSMAADSGLKLHRILNGDESRAADSDGLLVDTIGELAGLFPLARAAFIGGSLVPVGGHNVLEPAAAGVPVLFGPHTGHFEEPVADLLASDGGIRVQNADELAAVWSRLLAEPEEVAHRGNRAREVVTRNQGAMQRSVDLILGNRA